MKNSSHVTRCALLFALCAVLNFAESGVVLIPAFPGVKAGLANVPIMFALFSLGFPTSITLAVAKGIFSLVTRGASAGILSLAGGVLSLFVMYILHKALKDKISTAVVSILGAVTHNLAQLGAISLLWGSKAVWSMSPILIVSGVVFGTVNALLLKVALPYLSKIGGAR